MCQARNAKAVASHAIYDAACATGEAAGKAAAGGAEAGAGAGASTAEALPANYCCRMTRN